MQANGFSQDPSQDHLYAFAFDVACIIAAPGMRGNASIVMARAGILSSEVHQMVCEAL